MNRLLALSLLAAAAGASAHVAIDEPRAEAGRPWQGVLRVGHGCDGTATTALTLRAPRELGAVQASPKPGWTISSANGVVTWKAAPGAGLPAHDKGEFPFAFTAPPKPGPLWLKVLQECEGGRNDWADVPAQGTSTAGMKTPAVLLDVMTPAQLALARSMPKVEGGWVRGTVAGQQASGAFMKITAKEPVQIVGASTPVAGVAEVHEMKMEGDVMRMRPAGPLAIDAGQTVELKPGGHHLMLMALKQTLQPGTTVPVTLLVRTAQGQEGKLELQLPVAMQAPGAGTAASAPAHKH